MLLKEISLLNFRNLQKLNLCFHPKINVFCGPNGSGKTSILESIYFLTIGRSFRANKTNNLIKLNQPYMAIRATYMDKNLNQNMSISTLKYMNQDRVNKIGGSLVSLAEIASFTPTQLINEDISKLIFKEAEGRRKFIDWLVFYVNNNYHALWNRFNQVLQQRNKLLKNKGYNWSKVLEQTNKLFSDLSHQIADARQRVWQNFQPFLELMLRDLNIERAIIPNIELEHGWAGKLLEQLILNQEYDLKIGFTSHGPHKADLKILVEHKLARDLLSRGQGKILALAFMLSRAKFIADKSGSTQFVSTLLVDDFWSELDDGNTQKIVEIILNLTKHLQLFITTTDQDKAAKLLPPNMCSWFRVNNGTVHQL